VKNIRKKILVLPILLIAISLLVIPVVADNPEYTRAGTPTTKLKEAGPDQMMQLSLSRERLMSVK